jgi:hypothetical protein
LGVALATSEFSHGLGRLEPLSASTWNDRLLREPDGWSRR